MGRVQNHNASLWRDSEPLRSFLSCRKGRKILEKQLTRSKHLLSNYLWPVCPTSCALGVCWRFYHREIGISEWWIFLYIVSFARYYLISSFTHTTLALSASWQALASLSWSLRWLAPLLGSLVQARRSPVGLCSSWPSCYYFVRLKMKTNTLVLTCMVWMWARGLPGCYLFWKLTMKSLSADTSYNYFVRSKVKGNVLGSKLAYLKNKVSGCFVWLLLHWARFFAFAFLSCSLIHIHILSPVNVNRRQLTLRIILCCCKIQK